MTDQQSELRHARFVALWVGVLVPLGLTLIATVIIAIALPQLPATVAMQFNFSGTPSNFGPAATTLILSLGVGGLLSLISLLVSRQPDKKGQVWTRTHRFMPALMLGCVAMIQIMAVGTTLLQVGLTDARDMPNPTPVLLAALISWPILTVIGYAVQPKLFIDSPAAAASAPMPLARGERVVWVGRTSLPKTALIVIGIAIVTALAITVTLALLGNAQWWVLGLITLLLCVAAWLGTVYRVRIDRTGLTARAPFGWPVFRVPAAEIDRVTVGDINALGEFGGWGIRSTLDGFGLVLRNGPGLRIRRRNGRLFAITLDHDADTAASVLAVAAETSRK